MKEYALQFVNWLMDNCELAEDNSLWTYNSEDYTNEKLYEIFSQQSEVVIQPKAIKELLEKNYPERAINDDLGFVGEYSLSPKDVLDVIINLKNP